MPSPIHPAWLPEQASTPLATAVHVAGTGPLVATVTDEVRAATGLHGGHLEQDPGAARLLLLTLDRARGLAGDTAVSRVLDALDSGPASPERYAVVRSGDRTVVVGEDDHGLLYGTFALLRHGAGEEVLVRRPGHRSRMLDHWDNMVSHPVMGTVERGYAGDSLFFSDGAVRADLGRVARYARLLASIGINGVAVNNVNVHRAETGLLGPLLPEVARIADVLRPWGIRLHLSVSFASPIVLGGLATADPLAEDVVRWWAEAAERLHTAVPDFGGFVVKADSEGQPGPFAYGRDHADGANVLARALAPHGGVVHWRAFVYDHRQDWRDRSTDRARAAHDHFAPLDGRFEPDVVLQVKHGPIDFQVREPVSPVLAAVPATTVAVELQLTQEYTGQQRHVCYLGPAWSQVLTFGLAEQGTRPVHELVQGGVVGVANVGTDEFWTGHPLAQSNLFAFGALAWDPTADPDVVLREWAGATFGSHGDDVVDTVCAMMTDSWATYESYTAPLGIGFMVRPGHHYGPDVDGYEYTPWGTYHFADREGIGVDRTRATGTGFTGQYPSPWRERYEDLATCPDELLLFFHHVPYTHRLRSGRTVVQHVYDTHLAGVERVEELVRQWAALEGRVEAGVFVRVQERLAEQRRSAQEWCDQVCTYFLRHSGIPDEHGRLIHP